MAAHIPRVYQPCIFSVDETIVLSSETAHHLYSVLRKKTDDPIILFNGDGKQYAAKLDVIKKNHIHARIEKEIKTTVESPHKIHLGQALCRNEKMDLIIQKAVELGVSTITPIITEHVNLKLNKKNLEKKLLHWNKIIISSAEQSGRTVLPVINPIMDLGSFLTSYEANIKFVAHPTVDKAPDNIDLSNALASSIILIGPEGGFSDEEFKHIQGSNYHGLSLGPRILRAETAAICALSYLQLRFGDVLD